MPHDAGERALHLLEGTHAAAVRADGQKAGEQLVQLDLMGRDLVLDEVADDREQQDDEREGGEEQVEGERACEKGNVVLEGRLQRAPHDAGDRPMPPAFVPHASGSSSSAAVAPPRRAAPMACRRRRASSTRRFISARAVDTASASARASSTSSPSCPALSAARSRSSRSLPASRRREPLPASGANRKPIAAPTAKPSRNPPNPAPPALSAPLSRSLIRPPPGRPAPRPLPPVVPHATGAAASRGGPRWRAGRRRAVARTGTRTSPPGQPRSRRARLREDPTAAA